MRTGSSEVLDPPRTRRGHGHPIQVVMRRTGLSADVIRAWERRYAVVEPGRSEAGRRVYTDADVDRLRLLARATLTGRTIGQVARLPNDALLALLDAAPPAAAGPTHDTAVACLRAVERFDVPALDGALRRAVIARSAESFLDELVGPLWTEVVERERAGTLRAAHRHLTLAALRRVLERVIDAASVPTASAGLLVTTLPGVPHASQELGTLLSAACAAAAGWRVMVAGLGMPGDDAADLAESLGTRAVVVSMGAGISDRSVGRELRRLRARLPHHTLLLEGPAAAAQHASRASSTP